MIVITDSARYTENLFKIKPDWQPSVSGSEDDKLIYLLKKHLLSVNIVESELDISPLWDYAFVTEQAAHSQFSILMETLRNNTGFTRGILCLAGSGQNFKGYRNRKWESLTGNIHLSMFLNPGRPVKNFHTGFTILSAVSVVQTIDAVKGLGSRSAIKWVNDILIDKAKVSGVLTQTQTQGDNVTAVFLGIGINVQATPVLEKDIFVPLATSLSDHAVCSESEVLRNLLHNITENYRILVEGGYHHLLELYRKRSLILGSEVTVYSDPADATGRVLARGKVVAIGENLELWFQDSPEPVSRGRVVF